MALTAIKIHKNMILIGDVNVNTTMTSNDLNTLEYEAVLADLGLDRGIWDYTREEIRVGSLVRSCIDHIYYSLERPVERIYTGVVKVKISDHYPVVARIELSGGREGDTENEKIIRLKERQVRIRLEEEQWTVDGNETNEELRHNFYIPKATPEKIMALIKNMNPDKSPGIDNIRMKDLKIVMGKIAKPLATLINTSISQGDFPNCLKNL
ncbi:hypothetical protein J6590_093534 [Homalodisca vitripennis]|nr:hypothetical protein J6590_093534 [Homalodisca vitripennis]